jgi:DNA adenine methylase
MPRLRPFVKWAGGKRQIIPLLKRHLPEGWNKYFEPFLGGGALLFEITPPKAVVSDLNYELINAYRVVKERVEELIEVLKRHRNEKDYYYRVRDLDPDTLDPVERAGRFLYLNKTCYNGLYRVNSRGKFNVPFGFYKNPKICDEDNLRAVSEYLRGSDVKILHCDYRKCLEEARRGDFVYLDPPYDPVSRTSRFTEYLPGGFGEEDQLELARVFRELTERGVLVLLSNSDTPLVRELYGDFYIETVPANRNISCRGDGRKNHRELIIKNY